MTGFLDLSTSMILNDLEPPKRGFLENFSQFLDATHSSTLNCNEMAEERSRQSPYETFNIKCEFQQSKCSRRPAQAGVKYSYPLLKVVILPQLSRVS